MANPFRFGVQLSKLPADGWRERLRRIEALGYASVFCPDHFGSQWEPTATIAAAAAVTERLRVGTLVYGVDYRHPVVLAKAAATIHLLSGGRCEFGIGAGWMESDYREAGMPYDAPGVRIARLEEAVQIIRSMWTQPKTSFAGEHYRVTEIEQAVELPEGEVPRLLIGGGGKRLLTLAGRYADIVGVNPRLHEGRVSAETPGDLAPERVRQKVSWVRDAAASAGRDPDRIELSSLSFVVAVTDDPKPLREALSRNTGMSVEQVADCPLFLTGSAVELRDRLEQRREQTGISYTVIQGGDPDVLEAFAEAVVAPLSGT
ncbi:MAG: TIGR03621 family F420-dependent LLM class oxidoreductase [Myxococcota bacterium]